MIKKQNSSAKGEMSGVEEKAKAGFYDYYEATISLIKAVIWPAVILFFFLVFRGPITDTVEELPNLFSKTTLITVGSVTIEVDQRLLANANPKLRDSLSKLSAGAIRLLVKYGGGGTYTNSSYPKFAQEEPVLRELAEAGLIEFKKGITDNEHPGYDVKLGPTDLGRQAYSFVLEVVIDQFLRSMTAGDK